MPRLRISVITPSYNQARFLGRTLRSVLDQRGAFDLEYLVIDGGSTDGSQELLGRHRDRRLSWSSEATRGQVDAINRGLRRATGDVVGWLNSDDVLLPGALARVAAAFAADPGLGWLHGRCDIIDENDRVIRRFVSHYKHRASLKYSFANLIAANFVSQMTAYWRRSLRERVGDLDPGLGLAFDYDLWLRLAACGPPRYIPRRLACFRWYESSKSGRGYRAQLAEDFAVALRHTPRRPWLRLRKLARTAQILAAYELMAWGRAWRRRSPPRALLGGPPAIPGDDLATGPRERARRDEQF